MTKVLPFARWKKEKLFERETFSNEDSDEEDSDYEEFVVTKRSKQNESVKPEELQTNPKTSCSHSKEGNAASDVKQATAKKPTSGINGFGRPPLGPRPKRFLSLLEDNPRGDQL